MNKFDVTVEAKNPNVMVKRITYQISGLSWEGSKQLALELARSTVKSEFEVAYVHTSLKTDISET